MIRFSFVSRWVWRAILSLVLVLHLAWLLVQRGFYWPARMVSALRVWRLFAQANRVADAWMAQHLSQENLRPAQRRRFLRYARNTLGLVAIQPPFQRTGWNWPRRESSIGAAYGICIPLFDDCFDLLDLDAARSFGQAFQASLSEPIWRPEAVPLGMPDTPHLLRTVSTALFAEVRPEDRLKFTELLREMTDAQLESLDERLTATPIEQRRQISTRKGVASFRLLLVAIGQAEAAKSPALAIAAEWAQWMDDYDDLESDAAQGSWTYMAHLHATNQALSFLETQLDAVSESLNQAFNGSGRLFADVLSLNFVIKVAHRRTWVMAQKWGVGPHMPRFFWKGGTPDDSGTPKGLEGRGQL